MKIKHLQKTINIFDLLFGLLLIINALFIHYMKIKYFTYITALYLITLLFAGKRTSDICLLFSLFIPNKYFQLLFFPLYLYKSKSFVKSNLKRFEILFLIYIFIVSILNCFFYNGLIFGTIFQVGLYYCIFKFLAVFNRTQINNITIQTFDYMLWVQLITCGIEFLCYKSIGDYITGTLISAHYLGVFLIVYLYLLIKQKPSYISINGYIVRVTILIILLWISDAKHVWPIFILSFLIIKIFSMLKIKRKITVAVTMITFIIVAGTMFANTNIGANFASKLYLPNIYILNNNYNKKMVHFTRTFNEMKSLSGLFGFGVGQFGSQISLTLSKGIIYDWNPKLSAYHYAITPYRKAIQGLMTEWYTNEGIGLSSMALGYPLVSFVGLFAELGIIGYISLLLILDNRFRNDGGAFIIAFFILSIFDAYFEIPCVFVLILAATYADRKNIEKNRYIRQTKSNSFNHSSYYDTLYR